LTAFEQIKSNLNSFIKKYYKAQLIKGILLFLALGLLFFMVLLGVEYFLWLNSSFRLVLLVVLFVVEVLLLYQFIILPILFLYQIKNGLDNKKASYIIGKHFPEIDDKLYNLVELESNTDKSELLLASIHQRSSSLLNFKFSNAVNYKKAYSYTKWLGIPLVLIVLIYVTGDLSSFFQSYKRVVNYDLAFEKPAPFTFQLISTNLSVLQNQPLVIAVSAVGEIKPENVFVNINGEDFLMQESNEVYQYKINSPKESFSFYFKANEYTSHDYKATVKAIPAILDFQLALEYPKHTNKPKEVIKNGGNAILLEGTKVNWLVKTESTKVVAYKDYDTVIKFTNDKYNFRLTKRIYNSLEYSISTSNEHVHDFEKVDYSFKVVKDQFPQIIMEQKSDSLIANQLFFSGKLTDDYGISYLKMVYYDTTKPDEKNSLTLLQPNATVASFYYTFPSGIKTVAGVNYSFYFEVADNDGVNGSKKSRSAVYNSFILDDNQLKNKELERQNAIISNIDKSVNNQKEQIKTLEELSNDQKEKNALNYNDKSKLNAILDKQKVQENQMQKFSNQLKENLKNMEKDDELNKILQERLERQEIQAKKNNQLLEELKKVADKLEKEELTKRLEDLAKSQKNGQRNLEQLLELTKRYYVTEMASQLAKDLEDLAKKQDELAKNTTADESQKQDQKKLNTKFNNLAEKLEELLKDNTALKKPISIDVKNGDTKGVKEDQKAAIESLEKSDSKEAGKKQKSAADKMKELANKLEQSSSGAGGSNATEDAEVLRQILDNLVTFTFKQEALIDQLNQEQNVFKNQSRIIVKQQELKSLFEHVDDSLFALSIRVPEISESINKEVTDIYYNLDKAVENITESNNYQGISYQKYVLNSGNTLSDMLASILENMQQNMKSGKGKGSGEDFQLPDIIKGQGELNKKLGDAGKEGQGKSGEKGSDGKEGKEGQKGSEGTSGKDGSNGEGGKSGEKGKGTGSQGNEGQKGKDGKVSNGNEGNGENGQGANGNGNYGLSEEGLKEIYQIYKEQEMLKNKLEEQLQNMINTDDRRLGEKLIRQMEDFQNNLLENGVTRSTIDKATIIQYQLLKLEGAAMKQGKKNDRESNSNKNQFVNPILSRPDVFENYRNENEILNRQVLPLRQNYQGRIKKYFEQND